MDWLWQKVSSTNETLRKHRNLVTEWLSENRSTAVLVVGGTIATGYLLEGLLTHLTEQAESTGGHHSHNHGHSNHTQKIPFHSDIPSTPQLRNAQIKTRMQAFFRNTQKGCDNTMTSFIGSIRDKLELIIEIPTPDQIRAAHNSSSEEKMQLWEKVKIGNFTRTVSAIYAICLTLIFLRTEVNILGRYLYLDFSIQSNNNDTPTLDQEHINPETQKKYLSYYEHFLEVGMKDMCEQIKAHVVVELAEWPLARKCTLEDVLMIFANVRARVEGLNNPESRRSLFQFLLPPEETQSTLMDKQLNCLLNETRDVLESAQFESLLKACLEISYTLLADQLRESFLATTNPSAPTTGTPSPLEMAFAGPITLPMPKIFPIIRNRCKSMLEVGPQQDAKSNLVQILFNLPQLEDFSSSIFTSSYDE